MASSEIITTKQKLKTLIRGKIHVRYNQNKNRGVIVDIEHMGIHFHQVYAEESFPSNRLRLYQVIYFDYIDFIFNYFIIDNPPKQ